jgi:hypothetical protein
MLQYLYEGLGYLEGSVLLGGYLICSLFSHISNHKKEKFKSYPFDVKIKTWFNE